MTDALYVRETNGKFQVLANGRWSEPVIGELLPSLIHRALKYPELACPGGSNIVLTAPKPAKLARPRHHKETRAAKAARVEADLDAILELL